MQKTEEKFKRNKRSLKEIKKNLDIGLKEIKQVQRNKRSLKEVKISLKEIKEVKRNKRSLKISIRGHFYIT